MKKNQTNFSKTKKINSWMLILLTVTAISCAPVLQVNSDYDRSANFSSYKTFSMYNLTTTGNVNQLNADRIENSIRAEMIRKGLKENKNNPDLMVNAVTVLKDRRAITATTNYAYGGVLRPYGYWVTPGLAAGYTTVQTYNYKDGSLIIDVVDAKTKKMVWQGVGNGEIEKRPKNPEEMISNAVAKIMAGFPGGGTIN